MLGDEAMHFTEYHMRLTSGTEHAIFELLEILMCSFLRVYFNCIIGNISFN